MLLPILIALIPVLVTMIMCFIRNVRLVGRIVALGGALQFLLVLACVMPLFLGSVQVLPMTNSFFLTRLDGAFTLLTAGVAACAFIHGSVFYERELFNPKLPNSRNSRNIRINHACAMFFVMAMYGVFLSKNLGYLWITVESAALVSAPLVYFGRTKHSLEATWKYLIICSVGIVFALLGTLLIYASGQHGAVSGGTLSYVDLLSVAPQLNFNLLRFGYLFCLLGYGTLAGMFPLHNWLPDAHSEAPAPSSALLSGSLLNCALFAIFRISQVVTASQHGSVSSETTLWTGTVTVVAASLFLVRQYALKRLFAYSSIENVGVMLVAIGLNSAPLFFLQAINHSIAKVSLFLLSGNIIQATWKKNLRQHHGLWHTAPIWAVLMVLSAFAVVGAPPFGTFLAEWLILMKAVDMRHYVPAALCLTALTLSSVVICMHVGKVILGAPNPNFDYFRPYASSTIPAVLVLLSIILGITSGSTIWFGL
jgi:hydrogenase-4 component F